MQNLIFFFCASRGKYLSAAKLRFPSVQNLKIFFCASRGTYLSAAKLRFPSVQNLKLFFCASRVAYLIRFGFSEAWYFSQSATELLSKTKDGVRRVKTRKTQQTTVTNRTTVTLTTVYITVMATIPATVTTPNGRNKRPSNHRNVQLQRP